MSRLGLFGWMSRKGVAETVADHREALSKKHEVEVFDFGDDLPGELELDLALVFGGDGTILGAARYLAPKGIPAVGFNLGRFGFLACCSGERCKEVVAAALSGSIEPVERTMLQATITGGGAHDDLIALNDIAITSAMATHMIGLVTSINSAEVACYQGDGLIVATATGSTAYNLSSGGPLVAPSEDVLIVTALAPHTLSIRPMVISGSDVVDVTVEGRRSDISVTADGQVARIIKTGQKVSIRRAPWRFRLFEDEDWSFYKVVRSKLGWGRELNYAADSD